MSNLVALNDDCLLYLMRFLSIPTLKILEAVSEFEWLVNKHYKSRRRIDWSKDKLDADSIEKIGPNLTALIYCGKSNIDLNVFSLVNKYCAKIEILILSNFTLDDKFVTLVSKVLVNLKFLEIDNYLLGSNLQLPVMNMMLNCEKLTHLEIGEPFIKDKQLSHEYLEYLLNLKVLKLNLVGEENFSNIANYVSLSFLPLETLDLQIANDNLTAYDQFCEGLTTLKHLHTLKLRNLKNKHFLILIDKISLIHQLNNIHLICANGVILNNIAQKKLIRIKNPNLKLIQLENFQNLSFQFLIDLNWWNFLEHFVISRCDHLNDETILDMCRKDKSNFKYLDIISCSSITAGIIRKVEALERKNYLKISIYHQKEEQYSKFLEASSKHNSQYIHINNILLQK